MIPIGKGFYMWQLIHCEGGDVEKIVALACSAGLRHVLIKIADGPYPYNVSVDLVKFARALRQAGMQVWGWHYIYGHDPIREAERAYHELTRIGCDGYVIDAEVEYKRKPEAAKVFMTRLRALAGEQLPVGLASYRYPSLHPEFPWQEFRKKCNFDMPQVYWEQAQNSADQLKRSLGEFARMTPELPYIPSGSAYTRGNWRPTLESIHAFLQTAKANFVGCNFWEWANTRQNLLTVWDEIAKFDWPVEGQGEEEEDDMSLEALKAWRANQAVELGKLDQIIAALEIAPKPEPEPEPGPVTRNFVITRDPRANARSVRSYNAAGKPIWEIYPSDTAPVSDRVQFTRGSVVKIIGDPVTGDGGSKAYELYYPSIKEKLYILKDDGSLM